MDKVFGIAAICLALLALHNVPTDNDMKDVYSLLGIAVVACGFGLLWREDN